MGRTDERDEWLAERFEGQRAHLRAVAYRMLGSASEADDAVQEAWLRLNRVDGEEITNLGGWLTTVVGRVCLDMLRSRTSRREESLTDDGPEPVADPGASADPEREVILADAVGAALLVVLETLTPAERLAFVLHDLFAVPFDDIAPILGRSPAATRQLASRARRRVRPTGETVGNGPAAGAELDDGAVAPPAHWRSVGDSAPPDPRSAATFDAAGHRAIVDAFLAAARDGRFADLIALLASDVVLRADPVAVASARAGAAHGAPLFAAEIHGPSAVADIFSGRAQAARPALIDGTPGAVWAPGGRPRSAFRVTVVGDKIAAVEVIADPATLATLDIAILAD